MAFQPDTSQLSSIVREVSDQSDAEIYLYAGKMESPHDHQFIDTCPKRPARPNALLVLETYGGDADSAYEWFSVFALVIQRVKSFSSLMECARVQPFWHWVRTP